MKHYPVAYAHEDIESSACAIVKQLENRDQDPIMILVGEGDQAVPTAFHRRKYTLPDGGWSWEAVDDQGRWVRSGVVHDEATAGEVEEEKELELAGFPD